MLPVLQQDQAHQFLLWDQANPAHRIKTYIKLNVNHASSVVKVHVPANIFKAKNFLQFLSFPKFTLALPEGICMGLRITKITVCLGTMQSLRKVLHK